MKPVILFALLAQLAYSQQLQPVTSVQQDCGKFVTPITTAGTFTSATVDNRQAGCDGWVVTYSSNGFATVSVLLQSAPLGAGGIPGAFVSFAGTITAGPNPAVLATQSEIRATGYFPYINVAITTTGAGFLQAEFHGFKSNPNSGSGATGGCVGTSATPCVVDGPTAAGSAPTKPPVFVAGQDIFSAAVEPIATDTAGGIALASVSTTAPTASLPFTNLATLLSDNGTVAGLYTIPLATDGTNYQPSFVCTHQVLVTLANATLTALVPVSGATVIRVCQAHASTSGGSETISLIQGTGVACAAATTTIDSYVGVTAFSTDYAPTGALQTSASNGLCVQQSGAAQAAKVWISYAQY